MAITELFFNWLSSVGDLLFASCPSTVFLRVTKFIVNALDCVFVCRSRSHVPKKLKEICFPFGAHTNSSSTVVFVTRLASITTPRNHPSPHYPLCRSGRPMSRVSLNDFLPIQTAAALAIPGCKRILKYKHLCSARTATEPCGFGSFSTFTFSNYPWSNDAPSTKRFSDKTFNFSHSEIMALDYAIVKESQN